MGAYTLELNFEDTMTEIVVEKKPVVMSTSKADEFFKNFPKDKVVAYKDYWETVRPKTDEDIFRRYLFSFMSVHTTWESNVKGYQAVKNIDEWIDNKEILLAKIKNSGVGLHNNRTKYIWAFKDQFFANPKDYMITSKKYHVKKRDDIVNKIHGLGAAKTSFALEMSNPNECRVVCLDIHLLRLYNCDQLKYNKSRSGTKVYKDIERHWSINCGKIGVPCYIMRSLYWNMLQEKEDCRYWSFCLES
jgi:thermostable 8-oxoguanine DNA glycosylase